MATSSDTSVYKVKPLKHAPQITVRVPGSKSFTNRALIAAAMAPQESILTGALFADDTFAMIHALKQLKYQISCNQQNAEIIINPPQSRDDEKSAAPELISVDAQQSGTTARFLLPFLSQQTGTFLLDGDPQLRKRPMGTLLNALQTLGASITPSYSTDPTTTEVSNTDYPIHISGHRISGGHLSLPGHTSSQFLSGLLLSAPQMEKGCEITVTSELVSKPYVDITLATMHAFGVRATHDNYQFFHVPPGTYRGTRFAIEPDASAASYFFAAAAITGGTITIDGLGTTAQQGDIAFVQLLEQMGARVDQTATSTTVTGPKELHGITCSMSDISDTAQTLAVVAACANTPTHIQNIGFIRGKETDRMHAIITELQRCGISAIEDTSGEGIIIHPGLVKPARIETYDDHRMAMSFSLLGLKYEGIEIANPRCVNKTFPTFFSVLEELYL